jgi:hypothetical protein
MTSAAQWIYAAVTHDDYSWLGPALGSVAIVIAAVSTFYNMIQKWSADRQKSVVLILQDHIARQEKSIDVMQKQLAEKDGYLDELYELHSECEIREAEQYGWMERATDTINRLATDNEARGAVHQLVLALPPKRERTKRARYIREKSQFDSELARATNSAISAKSAEVNKEPEDGRDPGRR